MYIFIGRGVFVDVCKADDKITTSGTTSLAGIHMWRTHRAIDSVATGIIPFLSCATLLKDAKFLPTNTNNGSGALPKF